MTATVTDEIKDVDVVVIGLGPGGAGAAEATAAVGLDVVAFERKKIPGNPVQCAEFVPAMLRQEMAGLDIVTRQNVGHMVSFVEDEPGDHTPDFRGMMVDRDRFDAQLIAAAAAAGAHCSFGIGLRDVSADGVLVLTDGRRFRPRLLIGADGPRSSVGRAIGSVNEALVETRQITVPLLIPHDATDIFLRADIVGGYGWLFPKDDVANLGLGVVPTEKERLKPLLAALHEELVVQGRVGGNILKVTGGAIPVGGMIRCAGHLGDVPVLLVGDAAGLSNPITGGGIPAALQSGRMAAAAAADWFAGDETAIAEYETEVAEIFAPSLQHACRRRAELLEHFARAEGPDPAVLRRGWIGYQEYWAA
jgi:geranylgeranyl reductase family protein